MIKSITMKAGATSGRSSLRVDLSAVTIFVDPTIPGSLARAT